MIRSRDMVGPGGDRARVVRLSSWASVLAAVLIALPAPPVSAQTHVTTDFASRHQLVEGWGTCLIGWNLDNVVYQDPNWLAAYRDLGCNILRVPMEKNVLHGPDGRVDVPIAIPDDIDQAVALYDMAIPAVANYAGVAQWLATHALEPDRVRIVGSCWSPPHWLKGPTGAVQDFVGVTDKYPTPWLSSEHWYGDAGTGASIGGRLKTEDPWSVQQYGRYMAGWVEAFQREYGVEIYSISLQNESTFENPFDSMTFIKDANGNEDFTQYAKGLKGVKDVWGQWGMDTKIMGPHVAHFGSSPANPFALRWQNEMIRGVKNHQDPELIDFLDFYNANFYNSNKLPGTNVKVFDEGVAKNVAGFYHGWQNVVPDEWAIWHRPPGVGGDGKGIWFSETGGALAEWTNAPDPGAGAGPPGNGAIMVAQKMHSALVLGQAGAYVYWQMTDTGAGETQHTLLGTDHVDDPHESKKYCAYKHFSRYIRPGARRVEATFPGGVTSVGGASEYDTYHGLNVSAWVHDEDFTATIVLVNMLGSDQPLTIDVPAGMAIGTYATYRTSETESFARLGDVVPDGGVLSLTIPPWSVVTLHGVGTMAPDGDFNADGVTDAADVDMLLRALHVGDQPVLLDLTADRQLDQADADVLLGELLETVAGDANLDGAVGAADLGIFARNFGAGLAGWAEGDFTGDQAVGAADLGALARNFGWRRDNPVPAPPAIAGFAASMALLAVRRRRGLSA